MRTWGPIAIVVGVCALAPRAASAQGVDLKGWTADGKAVVEIQDGIGAWDTSWISGAENTGDFWGVCTPAPIKDAARDGDGQCTLCKDAASCGLTGDPTTTRPSMKSPDKKVKVKDKRKCHKDPDVDITHKSCDRLISFGKKGTIDYGEAWSGDKAHLSVLFRPDSGAAVLAFDACGRMDGVCFPVMYVVDLGGGSKPAAPSAAAAGAVTYAVALTDKKMHDAAGDNQGGEARIVVNETSGGKTKAITVEKISLYSEDSQFGLGDTITFAADGTPSADSLGADAFPADLAAAVKAHLPTGVVAAAGFVDDGDHHAFHFEVYAVVQDADGVHVVKQTWANDATEPSETRTLDTKL